MNDATVLLVTRDESLRQAVSKPLKSIGHIHLETVPEFEEACMWIQRGSIALMLAHLTDNRAGAAVVNLMRDLAVLKRPVVTLVLSDNYDAEQALALLRAGAADYLSRPLDLQRLAYLVDVLTARVRLALSPATEVGRIANPSHKVPATQGRGPDRASFYKSIKPLEGLIEQVRRATVQDVNILLGGETGTGKTWLAHLIHDTSPRKDEPFLTVNCGSLSATLVESEMFGHVRGAFTGADRDREGKFTAAGRGTLLLDDIDALPLELQGKLLRVVEERVFEPVGSNRPLPLQARLIAASNRSLKDEAAAGRFRADLYYRLNVVAFYLPALREYLGSLPGLAARFISELALNTGRPVKGVKPDALLALQEYHWPGNLRELRNALERAVILCAGECIGREDLPPAIGSALLPAPPQPTAPLAAPDAMPASALVEAKQDAEARLIIEMLARHGNNRLRTAAALGISRMTLYNKMHRYGLIGEEQPAIPEREACDAAPDGVAHEPQVRLGEAMA